MLANVNGVNIFYESTGDGPAILFVHGLGGTGNVWHAQRVALSKYFRVITIDLPGSGRSDKTQEKYSFAQWVEQIAALANQLQLGRFTLVGHSMTTILAQNFAARHGDRLDALILCGPLTELPPAGKDAFAKRAETVLKDGMVAIVDAVLAGGLTAATREANPALAGMVREMLASNCPKCYAGHCHALREASARADQANIRVPTLILDGDQDTVTPLASAKAIAAAIPGAKIRIVPDTAHLTMLERPGAFNAALVEFLAEI
jgi:3-oxoadipate enol-lactonase